LVFRGGLPSVLDFPFLCLHFFAFCSLYSYLSKLRMKHRVKLGHKDRVTLKITPSCYAFGFVGKPATRWCARFSFCNFEIDGAKVIKFKLIFVIEN